MHCNVFKLHGEAYIDCPLGILSASSCSGHKLESALHMMGCSLAASQQTDIVSNCCTLVFRSLEPFEN